MDVNVTIGSLLQHENAMMKTHHSQLSLTERITVFFLSPVIFRLVALYLAPPEVGLKAGIRALSMPCFPSPRCLLKSAMDLFRTNSACAKPALVSDQSAYSFRSGLLLFGYLLQINVLLGSIFGGIFIGLTFNGGIGVLESYTERVARQSQFEFGKARMWGSLGWAAATFCGAPV